MQVQRELERLRLWLLQNSQTGKRHTNSRYSVVGNEAELEQLILHTRLSLEADMFATRVLKIGFSLLALCGALAVWSLPAQAGSSPGTWRNGMVAGPITVGYYGADGRYYREGRRSGRRGYVREHRRPSRDYGDYYAYENPYARPRGYRSRGYRYGYSPEQYWLERREQEFRAYDSQRSR